MQLKLSYQQLSSIAIFPEYAERKDVIPRNADVEESLPRA